MRSPAHADGAVAVCLIATAPDSSAETADLLWRPVLGRPLIAWPLQALAACERITSVAIQAQVGRTAECRELLVALPPCPGLALSAVCRGERNWLRLVEQSVRIRGDWCIVVDATLPLLTTASLRAGLQAAQRTGVAIGAEPVKETLKRVNGQVVTETLPRERLRLLCSPLILSHDALIHVYRTLRDQPSTSADLVGVAQMAGLPLTTFDVDYPCVRVTSEHDLAIVESLLRQRESESSST